MLNSEGKYDRLTQLELVSNQYAENTIPLMIHNYLKTVLKEKTVTIEIIIPRLHKKHSLFMSNPIYTNNYKFRDVVNNLRSN